MSVSTFVLLTDPQLDKGGRYENNEPPVAMPDDGRLSYCSMLNTALNDIHNQAYPPSSGNVSLSSSCSGQIGSPACTVFAGDLTQFGGNYNADEWFSPDKYPHNYTGGEQLQQVRSLYDKEHAKEGIRQLTGTGPLYFGLGNHGEIAFKDTCSELLKLTHYFAIDAENGRVGGDPAVGWKFAIGDVPSYSDIKDHFRYQMWNFINQMHTGYKKHGTAARHPIVPERIHSTPNGTYDWKKYSFNYFIDMGFYDIYQLHNFGGDNLNGRATGLSWLKHNLALRGHRRPIIIVQHQLISGYDNEFGFTQQIRDNLLEILMPYNVIAFMTGHIHNGGVPPQYAPLGGLLTFQNQKGTLTESAFSGKQPARIIRPGAAHWSHFGLLRVEKPANSFDLTTNVLYGKSTKDGIDWRVGFNFTSPGDNLKALYVKAIRIHYFDSASEDSPELPTLCTEFSHQSADINEGFGGKFVYIRPIFTDKPEEAISSVRTWKQASADPNNLDLAKGTGGEFRYVAVNRNEGTQRVKALFLLRSKEKRSVPEGCNGMTEDINKGRGGSFLYLVWRY